VGKFTKEITTVKFESINEATFRAFDVQEHVGLVGGSTTHATEIRTSPPPPVQLDITIDMHTD
jgi:hypothetical protein